MQKSDSDEEGTIVPMIDVYVMVDEYMVVSVSSSRATPRKIIHFRLGFSRSQKASSHLEVPPWPWKPPYVHEFHGVNYNDRQFAPDWNDGQGEISRY